MVVAYMEGGDAMIAIHHVGILCNQAGYAKVQALLFGICGVVQEQRLYVPEFDCMCVLAGGVEYVLPNSGALLRWWEDNQHNGVCAHHFALQVVDIDQAMLNVIDNGYKLVTDAPVHGVGGTLVNFIHPEDVGMLIELVQVL